MLYTVPRRRILTIDNRFNLSGTATDRKKESDTAVSIPAKPHEALELYPYIALSFP